MLVFLSIIDYAVVGGGLPLFLSFLICTVIGKIRHQETGAFLFLVFYTLLLFPCVLLAGWTVGWVGGLIE